MLKFFKIYLAISFLLNLSLNAAINSKDQLELFKVSPILHEGRVKPIDTYARLLLKKISGKEKIQNYSAIEWFFITLTDSSKAYKLEMFKINDPSVIDILKIKPKSQFYYSFSELYESFSKNSSLINSITSRNEDLSPQERNILKTYEAFSEYLEVSRSLSFLYRQYPIKLLEPSEFEKIKHEKTDKLSLFDIYLYHINSNQSLESFIDYAYEDSQFKKLKIIQLEPNGEWISPWELLEKDHENPILKSLHLSFSGKEFNLINSFFKNDLRLQTEVLLNDLSLLVKSNILFILIFLLASLNLFLKNKKIEKLNFALNIISTFLIFIQISARSYILKRPPVSNLYESILFVNFVILLIFIYLEIKNKNGIFNLLTSIVGSGFLFLAFGFEGHNDSMGMLVAVLDTSFWLATHVLTISIGYGMSLVLSLLAHLSLLKRSKLISTNYDFQFPLYTLTLYALFFSILGTILGGIWADQSWGRFWGWDPKENGALFLCLWLLFVLHGKINRRFKDVLLDTLLAITGPVVNLAWFGVNLLKVGLHSYGFTDDIETNLKIYFIFEIMFISILLIKTKLVSKRSNLHKA